MIWIECGDVSHADVTEGLGIFENISEYDLLIEDTPPHSFHFLQIGTSQYHTLVNEAGTAFTAIDDTDADTEEPLRYLIVADDETAIGKDILKLHMLSEL